MIAFTLIVIRFAMFDAFNVQVALQPLGYALLIAATLLIAAGGYIINDIEDQTTDAVNRPNSRVIGKSISADAGFKLYAFLTILGVVLGFVVANGVGSPALAAVFIITAFVLYLYSMSLSQMLLVGNFVVSLIVGLTVLLPAIFDVYPSLNDENRGFHVGIVKLLAEFAIFAMAITFARELVKDLQDMNGDYKQGRSTLPIVLGEKRAKHVTAVVIGLVALSVFWYIYDSLTDILQLTAYMLFAVAAPILVALLMLLRDDRKYGNASLSLKVAMLTGTGFLILLALRAYGLV